MSHTRTIQWAVVLSGMVSITSAWKRYRRRRGRQPQPSCGITDVFDPDGRFITEDMWTRKPVCDAMMQTNCSESYSNIHCPETCAFLVPSRTFSCFFRCAAPEECGAINPDLAFPNPRTGVCSHCGVRNCRICTDYDLCAQCHDGFLLRDGGSQCTFILDWDEMMPLNAVLAMLAAGILFLAMVWLWKFGLHQNWEQNLRAIGAAMAHRHKVKVQDWNYDALTGMTPSSRRKVEVRKVRDWYPLHVNVHKKDILGVGLSLFYNSICFIAVVALISLGITWWVYHASDADVVLERFTRHNAVMAEKRSSESMSSETTPVPLSICGMSEPGDAQDRLQSFAKMNCLALGVLYFVIFIFSLFYGRFQKKHEVWFDMNNNSMRDYALCIKDLPRDETDEARLRDFFQEKFRQQVKKQGEEGRAGWPEVVGVSICYDFASQAEKVENLLNNWNESCSLIKTPNGREGVVTELELGGLPVPSDDERIPFLNTEAEAAIEQVQSDREVAGTLFEGPERLKGSGSAFVVFRNLADINDVWQFYSRHSGVLRHPSAPDVQLRVREVLSEPPTVAWQNMSVRPHVRNCRLAKAIATIVVYIIIFHLLLVRIFVEGVVLPYAKTGAYAGGNKMVIIGIILGNLNGLLCGSLYNSAHGVGFHERDKMDVAIFLGNVLLSMLNTGLNLYSTAFMIYAKDSARFTPAAFLTLGSLSSVRTENSWAETLYCTMMPGMVIIGYLMFPIMAGLVPYCVNLSMMNLIYVLACLPRKLLELVKVFLPWAPESMDIYKPFNAQKALEPMEIGLPWDYSSNIVLPSMCFCMLFFVSPFVWRTFVALFVWACFYYCWCRYMHLRFMKACYYSTSRLDSWVNFAWGFPLSIIAAASCVWGLRAAGARALEFSAVLRGGLVGTIFIASFAFWLTCYYRFVRPLHLSNVEDAQRKTVEEVAKDRLYTWFNCNPVFVLKCAYYYLDDNGKNMEDRRRGHPMASGAEEDEVRAYEIGKEYKLLSIKEREQLAEAETASFGDGGGSILEFETILEHIFGAVAWFCCRKAWGRRATSEDKIPVGSFRLM